MRMHVAARWGGVVLAVLGLGAFAPPGASAQETRVLLIRPRAATDLARQIERLEQAIARPGTRLVVVGELAEAEVVVQFTSYRRTVAADGEPQEWWTGQFKVLVPIERQARSLLPVPERFGLVMMGKKEIDMRRVVETLQRALEKALGRETPSLPDEAI